MKKEYKIYLVAATNRYVINYYQNDVFLWTEFYAYKLDDPKTEIYIGYLKHVDSL